jgi:glycosyltransferase involved in cell wall biosynthesis
LRILITVIDFPENPENIRGGVHSALKNLLTGFKETDANIKVLSFHKNKPKHPVNKLSNNIEIHHVYEGFFPFHLLNFLFFGAFILRKHIRDFKPDVIHLQEGNAFLFTKIFGVYKTPLVLTIHGMAHEEARRKKRLKDRITWHINGWIHDLLVPNNIIHLSQFSANRIEFTNGFSTIIPNAVTPHFFNVPLKTQFDHQLLYIGIVDNNKNIRLTLKTINQLNKQGKRYTLDVLGGFSHPAFESLIKDEVKALGLEQQVFFHGWVGQPEILEKLASSDILVVSSLHESLPMVIAEAKASGKLVVAASVGGIPEMIMHGRDGYLFKHSDESSLYDILSTLHDDPNLVVEMGKNARSTALNQIHSTRIAEKTIEFYNQILTSSKT